MDKTSLPQQEKVITLSALVAMVISAVITSVLLWVLLIASHSHSYDEPPLDYQELVLTGLYHSGYFFSALIVWLCRNASIAKFVPDWLGLSCLGTLISLATIYVVLWLDAGKFLTLPELLEFAYWGLAVMIFTSIATRFAKHLIISLQEEKRG